MDTSVLDELCRKLRLSHDQTLNALQTASIIEGSRIYEEMVNRKMYFGWLGGVVCVDWRAEIMG